MINHEWNLLRSKASENGIRILFLGDSLTYYNDMPSTFEAMANAAGKMLSVDTLTKGGVGLAMWREDPVRWQSVCDKIASDQWDLIVFEPQRNQVVMTEFFPQYPMKEFLAALDIVHLIREAQAIPLQYSTFGVSKGFVTREKCTKNMTQREHTELVTAYNATVAERIGCKAVYTGESFVRATERYPEIQLYHTDLVHPSPAGSYLIASDFYTVIFEESPISIPYDGTLPPDTAAKLREISADLLTFFPIKRAEIPNLLSNHKSVDE